MVRTRLGSLFDQRGDVITPCVIRTGGGLGLSTFCEKILDPLRKFCVKNHLTPNRNHAALHNREMATRKSKAVGGSDRHLSIDKLLAYWIDLSKRPTLTRKDYRTFIDMAEKTLTYFAEYYGWRRAADIWIAKDKFFEKVHSLVWARKDKVFESPQLSDNEYAQMKEYAKKFIPRIKKCFGQQLMHLENEKTPLQDAEELISRSKKLTYRWAAGIIASNHIAELLIRLSNFPKGQKFRDDIDTLYENLKERTKNPKLKRFLVRSHRRFEDADKTRNRCAHVNEGEPTRQEIEQSISLARLLQRFR